MSKFNSLILAALFIIAHSNYAKSLEACSQLRGHWEGFFTIKDQEICEMFSGCTHKINVDVIDPPTDLSTTFVYEALVNPYAGVGGAFEISCENGFILCADCPRGPIKVSCEESTACEVVFDNELLLSKLARH